jgi:hypothetical protein
MFIGVLIPVLLLVGVVIGILLIIRRLTSRDRAAVGDGRSVRRFFQYAILFGLVVVVAVGLSGLLGRVIGAADIVRADDIALARNLAFTVVGIPILLLVIAWTRRLLGSDAGEGRSAGFGIYVTVAALISLVIAVVSLTDVALWAVGTRDFDGDALARGLVWVSVWVVHWRIAELTAPIWSRVHALLGSLIGLVTAVTGLVAIVGGIIRDLLDIGTPLFVTGADPIRWGLATLVVGAPVWFLYWLRRVMRSGADPLSLAYLLLVGVAGGLVMAVIAASTVLYDVLVWFVGDPPVNEVQRHFSDAPTAAAFALIGLLVWWYHRTVLRSITSGERTEVHRIYEYVMAGIGLLAAAAGIVMVLVAVIETLTRSSTLVGRGGINALLAAATLLLVGGPVWWLFWQRISRAAQAQPDQERGSSTRRVYLFLLFGVGGVAAVVSLLTGVFILFEDVITGVVGSGTLRNMAFPLAILITSGVVAGYHWTIHRGEREFVTSRQQGRGPRFVLLIGPDDPALIRLLTSATGGRVTALRGQDWAGTWNAEEVMQRVTTSGADELVVIAEQDGTRVIPVERT